MNFNFELLKSEFSPRLSEDLFLRPSQSLIKFANFGYYHRLTPFKNYYYVNQYMLAFLIFISVMIKQDFDYNASYLMEISINLYLKGS